MSRASGRVSNVAASKLRTLSPNATRSPASAAASRGAPSSNTAISSATSALAIGRFASRLPGLPAERVGGAARVGAGFERAAGRVDEDRANRAGEPLEVTPALDLVAARREA